jgi:hypothetical protein
VSPDAVIDPCHCTYGQDPHERADCRVYWRIWKPPARKPEPLWCAECAECGGRGATLFLGRARLHPRCVGPWLHSNSLEAR